MPYSSHHPVLFTALLMITLTFFTTTVDAFKVNFDNEKALGYYRYNGYRQYPHWIIGVWGKYSGPAIGSGNGNVYPTARIHLEVINPPHNFFQFVIYDAQVIEDSIVKGIPKAHPCMYRGQRTGVAKFSNMSEHLFTEQASGRGSEILRDGVKHTMFSLTGDFILPETGLYVMTINSCVYNNFNGTPVLNLHGWENTIINGYFSVRNPYGYLPGELYGNLPGFAVLFAFTTLTLLIYVGACFYLCFKNRRTSSCKNTLMTYHYVVLATLTLSFFSYAIFVGYYNTYNQSDENKMSTFVAAIVFLKIRDAVALCGFFIMCYGYQITQPRLPRNWKIVLIICLLMNVICGLAVYGYDQAIEFNAKKRGGEEDSAEDPNLGRGAAMFAVVLSTGILVFSSLYYLVIHVRRLNPRVVAEQVHTQQVQATVGDEASPVPPSRAELQSRHQKYMLYLRTALCTFPLVLVAAIWAFVQVRYISDDGIEGETPHNWKAWWTIMVIPQAIITVFVITMAIWWAPIPSSRKLRYIFDPSANLGHDHPSHRDGENQHRTYVVEDKAAAAARRREERRAKREASSNGDLAVDYSTSEDDEVEMNDVPHRRDPNQGGITIHFQRGENNEVVVASQTREVEPQPRE